ncbi:MAG: hypothetical protein K8Q89_01500 [Nitrosarchaeum sp.]|nr:hypothetical protein [Nitrosarchaeum sp.]
MTYSWFKIKPFSTTVGEKYDAQKDVDLMMLCEKIPDVLFAVFNLPKSRFTLCLRVPSNAGMMVRSIRSFGVESCDLPVVTKINALVQLKLAKNSVYPLGDKLAISNIFSVITNAPYGVFVIKLYHTDSKPIISKYEKLAQKSKTSDTVHLDPHISKAKQKSECTLFFRCNMFFGVQNISDIKAFQSIIPYASEHIEPNRLVPAKIILSKAKNLDAATDHLKKIVTTQSNHKNMILSNQDILTFVRFPQNPEHLGLEPATFPTMASDSFDERFFDLSNPSEL